MARYTCAAAPDPGRGRSGLAREMKRRTTEKQGQTTFSAKSGSAKSGSEPDSFRARPPVIRLSAERCDCDYVDLGFVNDVHDGKRKLSGKDAACAVFVRCPDVRKLRRELRCLLHCDSEPLAQFGADARVVPYLVKQLDPCRVVKPDRFHLIRRRTSAKTSSAGMSLALPLSISSIRRLISSSQAAST